LLRDLNASLEIGLGEFADFVARVEKSLLDLGRRGGPDQDDAGRATGLWGTASL